MTGAEEVVNIVTTTATTPHNLSMLGLFFQASLTVKLVIILLVISSFWSWTIIFAKIPLLQRLKKEANRFEEVFLNSGSIDSFYDALTTHSNNPFVSVFIIGMQEWRRSKGSVRTTIGALSVRDRIESMMRLRIGREIDSLENHIGFLATVGSTAPFVGLFGTVWGIMNSFESIGLDQNTSLTAVAPGIAEALFATALGLIVTIPAVIAYNKISSDINNYQNRLDAFVEEFSAIISRELDENKYSNY